MDIPYPLKGTPMLQPHGRITRGLSCERLIVSQSLLEKLLLQGIESVLEPVLGNFCVHVVNCLACLLPLEPGLIAFAAYQHGANSKCDRRGDQ